MTMQLDMFGEWDAERWPKLQGPVCPPGPVARVVACGDGVLGWELLQTVGAWTDPDGWLRIRTRWRQADGVTTDTTGAMIGSHAVHHGFVESAHLDRKLFRLNAEANRIPCGDRVWVWPGWDAPELPTGAHQYRAAYQARQLRQRARTG